jgi:L-lysine 6-transaminase
MAGLTRLSERFPHLLSNVRGRGLMCAVDVDTPERRSKLLEQTFAQDLLVLACGARGVRFRPPLNVGAEIVAEGLSRFERALERVA